MENKKNKPIIILAIILSFIVLLVGAYFTYDKFFNKNEKNKTEQNSNVKEELIYKKESTVALNDKEHKLTYEYYYEKETDVNLIEITNPYYYRVKVKLMFDDNEINFGEFYFYRSQINHKTTKEMESHILSEEIRKPSNEIINVEGRDYLFVSLTSNNPMDFDLRLLIDNNKLLQYSFIGLTDITLKDTVTNHERFNEKDYYFEDGKLYHLFYLPESLSEDEPLGLYIYEINFSDELTISKTHLNEDKYEFNSAQ